MRDSLSKHNELVDFLESIASGLGTLADALDELIAASTEGTPEPIFLGKAGRIAQQLSDTVTEGLERHRTFLDGLHGQVRRLRCRVLFLKRLRRRRTYRRDRNISYEPKLTKEERSEKESAPRKRTQGN